VSTVLAGSATRTTGSARAARAQRTLVSLEVALCLALLMAGAVLVQGLRDLSQRSTGYESSGVLTAQIRLPELSYRTPEARAAVVARMLDEIRALPGVMSAGTTQNAFVPGFSYQTLIKVQDRPTADGQPHTVQFRRVSPGYFETLGIKALGGRVFNDDDTAQRPLVAIISKRFAETLMPGLDPIGRILLRNNPPPVSIIGVVDDAADVSVTAGPEATIYMPWSQNNNFGVPLAFVIKTAVDPASLTPAVRAVVKRVDPTLPLRRVQPLDTFVTESIAPERFRTMVLGIIAVLGLILAAVGISGVTYRGIIDRTKEFAVRLALGSEPGAVVRLVVRESVRDLAFGAIAGFAGGAALCGLLARSLENVGSVDALTTGTSVGVIAIVGVAAALVPALRIMRVDPAEVLRG
jgi:putative ABC transport system permease protein